jgi:hypothetical protein
LRLAKAALIVEPDASKAAWEELSSAYLKLLDEFHTTAIRSFGIDSISWKNENVQK